VSERADPGATRVEVAAPAGLWCQGIPLSIVTANCLAECPISSAATEALDPGVLVGRYGLRRELTTQRGGLFDKHDREALFDRSERSGDASDPAANDEDVSGRFQSLGFPTSSVNPTWMSQKV
jgi:hypothetical protein